MLNRQKWLLLAIVLFAHLVRAQTTEYIHTDALGSPVAVTNASGAVIERTVYEPYGLVVNRSLTDGPGYTGHVGDAVSGLNYMQQRYYDPALGRFLSIDPVGADSSNGNNFNRYWYANNNPYAFVDIEGACTGSNIAKSDGTCDSTGGFTTDTAGSAQGMMNRAAAANFMQASMSIGLPDVEEITQTIKDHLTPAKGTYQPPGVSAALEKIKGAANKAVQAYARSSLPMWLRGIKIHIEFAKNVRALGPDYAAEVSYYEKDLAPYYSFPGSIRADAIYGPRAHPVFAVELKTGNAFVSVAEAAAYGRHLPKGTPVYEIRSRPL